MTTTITKDEAMKAVERFRQLLSNRDFWLQPSAERAKAINELNSAYVNCEPIEGEEADFIKSAHSVAIAEYQSRRQILGLAL